MATSARSRWGLQAVLAGAIIVLMLLMAGAMTRIAFQHFEEMAHEAALTIFGQEVREGSSRFSEYVARAVTFVDV